MATNDAVFALWGETQNRVLRNRVEDRVERPIALAFVRLDLEDELARVRRAARGGEVSCEVAHALAPARVAHERSEIAREICSGERDDRRLREVHRTVRENAARSFDAGD